MTTTENNVAAQAGDELMREAFEAWARTDRYMFVPPSRMSGGRYVHPGMQGDWEVWQASQVSPRATADVERDAARYRWLRDKANGIMDRAPMVFNVDACEDIGWSDGLHGERLDAVMDVFIVTTKPGA